MEEPIRYGVVGIGGMGANHAKKLQENKIENAILTAVADSNVEYKNKYKNIPFFENIDNFFDNKIIDAAIIATPHKSHIDLAKKALEKDFKPISDMRASRLYRMEVAKNLLEKFCAEIKQKKLIGVYF